MPKRKVMESSDSATKTSIEPKRACQHGAATRIDAKQVVRSNDKALKLISNKAMSEMTHSKTNTTNRRTKPQTQLNGKYWKGMAESKDKAVTKELDVNDTASEESDDEALVVDEEAEPIEMSQSETVQPESETEDETEDETKDESPKKRLKVQINKTDRDDTEADLERRFQLHCERQQLQQQLQQQQLTVLKDLLDQERDKVHEYEMVIEKLKRKVEEQASQPCSSKQASVDDSFTSRKIPEFPGAGGEDEFESWKLRIIEFLKQPIFNYYNEDRRISTIKLGVVGTAAMVLEADRRNIHTTGDLIEALSKVYGVDKRSSECRAMQLEKESISIM